MGGPEQHHLSLTPDPSAVTVVFATASGWKCDTDPNMRSSRSFQKEKEKEKEKEEIKETESGGPSPPAPAPCECTYGPAAVGSPAATTMNSVEYTYTEGGWVGSLHRVLLTGLSPSTKYEYRCGGKSDKSFQFTSPPAPGAAPVVLGVVADLGENCDGGGCGNATIAALAAAAQSGLIGAILHAGDIAYTSGDQSIWDQYMREMESAAGTVPYQVCVGNHESHYNFSAYMHRFAMSQGTGGSSSSTNAIAAAHTRIAAAAAVAVAATSSGGSGFGSSSGMPLINNLWHTFTYGAVRVVALSTEHDHTFGSPQHTWLTDVLAAASTPEAKRQTPWLVVMAHRPLYCSTSDYYDCQINGPQKIAPSLEPLFHQYGVDLFIGGHLHNYERSWPVFNQTVVRKRYAWNGTGTYGTVHIVAGMAGDNEGLTDRWMSPTPEWSAYRSARLGWLRMSFKSAAELFIEFVDSVNGTVIDAFTIEKPAPVLNTPQNMLSQPPLHRDGL